MTMGWDDIVFFTNSDDAFAATPFDMDTATVNTSSISTVDFEILAIFVELLTRFICIEGKLYRSDLCFKFTLKFQLRWRWVWFYKSSSVCESVFFVFNVSTDLEDVCWAWVWASDVRVWFESSDKLHQGPSTSRWYLLTSWIQHGPI